MSKYILRLDDACPKMDIFRWSKMEKILDKYGIKPLVGVIPYCQDPMMDIYDYDDLFWDKVKQWAAKGWEIALHGYNHVYSTNDGGINPIHKRSEFAGTPLEIQKEKISKGIEIFKSNGIEPKVFFAPSHTFDMNTIIALKEKSNIRIISDTIANDAYLRNGITFIPQQSGTIRNIPFKTITFCYHPNTMSDADFMKFENKLAKYSKRNSQYEIREVVRKFSLRDFFVRKIYFFMRFCKKIFK